MHEQPPVRWLKPRRVVLLGMADEGARFAMPLASSHAVSLSRAGWPRRVGASTDKHSMGLSTSLSGTPKDDWSNSSQQWSRVGYSWTISGMVMPQARSSRSKATEMRVPRTRGAPPKCSGSETIHFSLVLIA
jgi:hypothetical protein